VEDAILEIVRSLGTAVVIEPAVYVPPALLNKVIAFAHVCEVNGTGPNMEPEVFGETLKRKPGAPPAIKVLNGVACDVFVVTGTVNVPLKVAVTFAPL